jgi:hypothetical protein
MVDPVKNARYVEDTEYPPLDDHFQMKQSGCNGCRVTKRSSSQMRR